MSFCYSIPKTGFPVDAWLAKIDQIIVPSDPGQNPPGTWRELTLSNMLRNQDDADEDGICTKYLTEGSIRGVLVRDDSGDIEIILNTFASRSDQALAARMAWEAIALGATVDKEGYGPIQAADLNAETIEQTHLEWFALSKASIRHADACQLPIYDFLSLSLNPGDAAKDDNTLEQELIAKIAKIGDAFLCTQLGFNLDGIGPKTASILQPELQSLMLKNIDVVAHDGGLIPIDAFVHALGQHALDCHGSWVFPPANQIDPATLQSLAAKALDKNTAPSQGPTDEEWHLIAQGPVLAFLLVAAADGKVDKKEIQSFGKVLTTLAIQQQHPHIGRMMRTANEQLQNIIPKLTSGQADTIQLMQAFNSLVNERFTHEDAKLMKASVLYLAREVANASGGFLGFGSKISKDEEKVLLGIAALLELTA